MSGAARRLAGVGTGLAAAAGALAWGAPAPSLGAGRPAAWWVCVLLALAVAAWLGAAARARAGRWAAWTVVAWWGATAFAWLRDVGAPQGGLGLTAAFAACAFGYEQLQTERRLVLGAGTTLLGAAALGAWWPEAWPLLGLLVAHAAVVGHAGFWGAHRRGRLRDAAERAQALRFVWPLLSLACGLALGLWRWADAASPEALCAQLAAAGQQGLARLSSGASPHRSLERALSVLPRWALGFALFGACATAPGLVRTVRAVLRAPHRLGRSGQRLGLEGLGWAVPACLWFAGLEDKPSEALWWPAWPLVLLPAARAVHAFTRWGRRRLPVRVRRLAPLALTVLLSVPAWWQALRLGG